MFNYLNNEKKIFKEKFFFLFKNDFYHSKSDKTEFDYLTKDDNDFKQILKSSSSIEALLDKVIKLFNFVRDKVEN